jgi:hypothetical protein
MLVFSYAVELDAADPKSDNYEALVREATKAYRTRAACARAKGDGVAAARDLKRADALDATVQKPASPGDGNRVVVRNEWGEPVTLVIGGVTYTLPPGEERTLATPAGSVPYEMLAGPHRVTGTLDAGRTYRVKPPSAGLP